MADQPRAPIPTSRLQELRAEVGDGLLRELVDAFLAEAPLRLAALRRAVSTGDASGLRLAVHALKGGSGFLGAGGMARVAEAIETLAGSGATTEAGVLVERLEAEFRLVRAQLDRALREGPP